MAMRGRLLGVGAVQEEAMLRLQRMELNCFHFECSSGALMCIVCIFAIFSSNRIAAETTEIKEEIERRASFVGSSRKLNNSSRAVWT